MTEALLVGLTVIALEFIETWFSYPMTTRPLVVGTVVGLVLGDVTTGVIIGAELELVFMGVMAIGGTVPPDACSGTAVGTAYAILLGQGIEVAFALAIPASILCQMLFVPLVSLRSLWTPLIDRLVDKGDYKNIERCMPLVALTEFVFKGLICGAAILIGSDAMNVFIEALPVELIDGMGVAAGMMAAVGFALLLKMMWTKQLAIYFFLGFIMAAYGGLPLMAIAIIGIILVVIFYYEGSFAKRDTKQEVVLKDEEELFND